MLMVPLASNLQVRKVKFCQAETISKLTHNPAEGAIGGAAQKVGGPFDKEGAIGKQFTTDGSVGGTVQEKLGGTK